MLHYILEDQNSASKDILIQTLQIIPIRRSLLQVVFTLTRGTVS